MSKFLRVALCLAAGLSWPAHLHAQPASKPSYDARTERLHGLSRDDLARLEPQLQAGPVALVEFANDDADELPAINVAAIVHAKPEALLALLQRPEGYPAFMRTLDHVEIVRRDPTTVVYDWRWHLSLLTLQGRNAMRLFAPGADRPELGYRMVVDSLSGDLGTGRISIRVLPHGQGEALLSVALRLDLRTANYVARQLARAARSVNRSADMSLAYSMLLGIRHEAERLAGYHPAPRAESALQKPVVDARLVFPLLKRGDLVLLDASDARLDRIAVLGLIYDPPATVRKVILDTDAFGETLLPGSEAKVVSRQGPLTTFDWDIGLPLIGVSGRMQVRDADPLVSVDAIDGALQGGRWNFEAAPVGKNASLLWSWARFDLRNSTWFVRSLADADPYLGHGMSAASQILLVRGLRTETMERAEREAHATKPH